MIRSHCLLVATLLICTPLRADDTAGAAPRAGHSAHGEAFDKGPRQAATLIGGTGRVHLGVTTNTPGVQELFDQGIGQLHGFWYFEAERSFRQAAALDHDCAMAYWGMAMANINNGKRAKQFMAEAVKRKATASPREGMWIDALADYYRDEPSAEEKKDDDKDQTDDAEKPKTGSAKKPMKPTEAERRRKLVGALEAIVYQYPDEIEAKAFLSVLLWQSREKGLAINSPAAVDSLIGDVLRVEPMHPVHHYRIHLWDDAKKADRALGSAALCGPSAPAIAHMWHMPGHTYSRLSRWNDAAWQQEAASRVDHAYMIGRRVLPDEIHNYAHNQEWLIRTLATVGQVHRATELARQMIALPRHPGFNVPTKSGTSSAYGRTRLLELLARFELWDELIALADSPWLDPVDQAADEAQRLRALGAAYFATGDRERGKQQIAALETLLAKANDEQKKPEQKSAKDAKKDEKKKKDGPAKAIEAALAELRGRSLSDSDPKAALVEFEKAKMSKEFLSRAQLAAGNQEKAEALARQATSATENDVYALANLVDVLHRLDKPDEAANAFGRLRAVSAGIDLDLPVIRRAAVVAAENNLPQDWRRAAIAASDVGPRPQLDRLGPARWSPPPAPTFRRPKADGSLIGLDDYRGRPVILIFYLGFGCLHCVEQLQAFAPTTSDWAEQGISLLAVSTDGTEALGKSLTKFEKDGAFPFPIVSDSGLEIFKAYGAHDDFESRPLHATV
ncbi:MAG TPA: redoxin domain-containing protein, partial [Pirellulales bacterium]|nr:redoxin domain-containing protein [Pirellulales bacterium]